MGTLTTENLLKHVSALGQRLAQGRVPPGRDDGPVMDDLRAVYRAIKQGDDPGEALWAFGTRHRLVEPNMVSLLAYAATVGLSAGSGWAVVDGDLVYQGIT